MGDVIDSTHMNINKGKAYGRQGKASKRRKMLKHDYWRLISRIFIFLKSLSSGLKIIHSFAQVDRNVYKTANKSASIHTNQILLSSNRLELSPWSFTHVFKKIETTMRWNCMSKALRFPQLTASQTLRLFIFYRISNHKTFTPKYLDNAHTDFA